MMRSEMDAFLENPMFLLLDDAEPILPLFRPTNSTLRSDMGRIVELADVGCDTETTFSVHFSRGAPDRRRGGVENFKSARRSAKWSGNKTNEFTRRVTDMNNNEVSKRDR